MSKNKRLVALVCVLLMTLSSFSVCVSAAGNPMTVNGTVYDNSREAEACDISVMSFNILQSASDTDQTYADPATRLEYFKTFISTYEPDIIGVQEASDTSGISSSNTSFVWSTAITSAMSSFGYNYIDLGQQINATTDICNGLIIFYSDRFTADSTYYKQMTVTDSYTTTDSATKTVTKSDRYFQRVKLVDTEYNSTPLYVYNTHLSINPENAMSSPASGEVQRVGNVFRTAQIKMIFDDVNSTAKGCPFFVVGDFNTALSSSADYETYPDTCQLGYVNEYPYVSSSAVDAIQTVSANSTGRVDQIFVNADYCVTAEHRAIQESVNGRNASDHFGIISYNNYAPNISFDSGEFDRANGTLTDETDADTYTFNVTDGTTSQNITYVVSDAINDENPYTVSLTKSINIFDIDLICNSVVIDTIQATIHYSGAERASITATGSLNSYFKNDAYHIVMPSDTTATALTVKGGKLYKTAACSTTQATSLSGLTSGRTTYYVKTTAGDVYPVHVYIPTALAESGNVLYVDDDIPAYSGYAPFYNGKDVIIVTAGSNGLDTFQKAAAKASSTTGYTIYLGTGNYTTNTTSFTKNVTILGANHDVVANAANTDDGTWSINSDRREETYFDGTINFKFAASVGSTYAPTVKGIWFCGDYSVASIYFNTSGTVANLLNTTIKMDIQNNIFKGCGSAFNHDDIYSNTAIAKAGIIAGNFFDYTGNGSSQDKHGVYTGVGTTRDKRAIQFRNVNGLVISNNRFANYNSVYFLTSEYQDSKIDHPGYAVYTVQDNRFDACSNTANNILNVSSETVADIKYLNNDFIRCGYYSNDNPIININLYDHKVATDYSKCSITIQGNNFLNGTRAIAITRSNTGYDEDKTDLRDYMNDINDMTVKINQNRFMYPIDRHDQANIIPLTLQFAFLHSADNLEFDQTLNTTNWNLKYNYFYSPVYTTSTPATAAGFPTQIQVDDVYSPVNYMKRSVKRYNSDGTNETGNSFALNSSLYAPYYTNEAMTTLSNGSTVSAQSGITATGFSGNYDGDAHSITVNGAAADATISYSLDNVTFTAVNPTFSKPVDSTTVYYKVVRSGYKDFTGSATIKINKLSRSDYFDDATFVYDGAAHTLTPTVKDGDVAEYTYAGVTSAELPEFTDVGEYQITAVITNDYYSSVTDTATLTITEADLEDVSVTGGYDGVYDGESHTITITDLPENAVAEFSVDGGEYTYTAPSYQDVGEHTVAVRLSGRNYITRELTFTFNITPAIITGITVEGYEGNVDGSSHGVTVTGTVSGDKVYYSVNGGAYTTTAPALSKEGIYLIAIRIDRTNYDSKHFVATVSLTDGSPNLFSILSSDIVVTDQDSGKSNMYWETTLDLTDEAATYLSGSNVSIVSYGIKYAQTMEDLTEYAHLMKTGQDASAYDETVIEIVSAENTAGLNPLYRTTKYLIKNIAPLNARFAMPYIRYTIDGTTYEEYGAVNVSSTYLDNGEVSGSGDTEDRDDILDD